MMTLIRVLLFVLTIIYLEGKLASNKKRKTKRKSWTKQNLKAKDKCKPTKDSILITRYATSIIQLLPGGPWDLKKVFAFTFMLLNKLTNRTSAC